MSLIIIQCGNKTDTQTSAANTNEAIQSNETIPATKILSQADAVFLDKVKNKIVIEKCSIYFQREWGYRICI